MRRGIVKTIKLGGHFFGQMAKGGVKTAGPQEGNG